MNEILLNGTWLLRDEDLSAGIDQAPAIANKQDGWITNPVPGDIHQGLIDAKKIKDPLLALNSYDCHWTENRSWWFKKTFPTNPDWLTAEAVELELNTLDSNAFIFLNGNLLGNHKSSFYPFITDIKKYLNPTGENILLVRLTTGLEEFKPEDLKIVGYNYQEPGERPNNGDVRHWFVRKPQYACGWDWSPPVITTAIGGSVKIRWFNQAVIRDVYVRPAKVKQDVFLNLTVTVESLHDFKTANAGIDLTITDEKGVRQKASRDVLLRSGLNYYEFSVLIKKPLYWWPNGMGDQHRYTIDVRLTAERQKSTYPSFKFGLRFVELDTKDKFAFIINGKKIFCKGANWIPADTIYARVTADRYDHLVREAANANFNMLRIWGGGLYEDEAFYDACDRYGIMLWHDFMFACAPYPDQMQWFRDQVSREADYQTRRLRNHASIVLWSGNNECNWGLTRWWGQGNRNGYFLYNYLLPEIARKNCPDIPYWNGSPYGGEDPNSSEVGDRHHWHDCMMNKEMAKRISPEEYDLCTSKFVSEYGYIGAPLKETVLAYLDGAPLDRQGKVWQHHNNTFEKNTVDAGIKKHYIDPEKMTVDDYFLYSGLTQGLMYGYSLDSLRFNQGCHGALFWMYEDCWGEIGWTIMDYYLRRKISYYFVKRALAPVRLIIRENKGKLNILLANDTQKQIKDTLEFGKISTDGKAKKTNSKSFTCPANERKILATFKRDESDPTKTLWFAKLKKNKNILPAILRTTDFRNLKLQPPTLNYKLEKQTKGIWKLTITSNTYTHAINLDLPENALPEDNYFDLLPTESRQIIIHSQQPLTEKNIKISSYVNF